jgi:amino acid permease
VSAIKVGSRRIILFYVFAASILTLNVFSDDPILSNGTYYGVFQIMIQRAGLSSLFPILNVVMLLAALTVSSSSLHVAVFSFHSDV